THQLLPVLFRVRPLPLFVTIGTSILYVVGFVLLVAGFSGAATFEFAAIFLGVATIVWVVAMLTRIMRAQAERRTAIAFGVAIAAFSVAGSLGVAMLLRWTGGFASWLPQMHASLMLLSFASIAVVALSYKFVPMFALAHADAYGSRAALFFAIAATVVIAVGVYARIGYVVLLVIAVILGWQHLRTLAARLRKRLDASLLYAAASWSFGIVALLCASIASSIGTSVICLTLMGWIAIAILGYAMKILGFLAWQYARERGVKTLLPLGKAIPETLSRVALCALLFGTLATAACLAWAPGYVRLSASIYLVGSVCYVVLFGQIAQRYVFAKVGS
ncbi:MAG: hypothetical protein ACYDA1_10570, partial [Vulcanimicrobiaceae bacterium]